MNRAIVPTQVLLLLLLAAAAVLPLPAAAYEAGDVDVPEGMVKALDGIFSYDTTRGNSPVHWAELDEEFSACGAGQIQSPINFPVAVKYGPLADGPQPDLKPAEFTLGTSSWNWALNCHEDKTCGYTMFAGKKWHVLQTHFHAPSEHTLMGKQYPMESHTVQVSDDGDFAVIATMFDYPDDNAYPSMVLAAHDQDYGVNSYMAKVLDGVTNNKGTFELDIMDIVNPQKGFCTYTGSLTTPPCSEGVTFLMQMHIETVSRRQVHNYRRTAGMPFEGNNRPVQPLNGRDIMCYL